MCRRFLNLIFLFFVSITNSTFCLSQSKIIYIVPFAGYDPKTFGTTEDELVFTRLKSAFNTLGYECKCIYTSQIEKLSSNNFEYLILLNYNGIPKRYLENLAKENLVLMCFEPETVDHENHDPSVHNLFGKVITCFDRFEGPQYYKFFYWPWVIPSATQKTIPFKKRKLATLINGCKQSKHTDELYSQRLSIINFFEKLKTNDFEFYGHGWDSKKYKTYRGSIPTFSGKRAVLEKYRFCFCFENIKNEPGYVSEKILDCLNSGCVPIYWGASNIDLYIPKNCYILREDFGSWQDIYNFIKNMPEKKYQEYLNNIKNYVSSDAAFLFSNASFVDSVLTALFPNYDRTKIFNKLEISALTKKDAWIAKNLKGNSTMFKSTIPEPDTKNELWNKLKDFKPSTNKNFVIVIASYNNKNWVQKNLDSVFMQKYNNYHVIYVDDCSPDDTGKFVEQYVKEKKQEHKVILIKNTARLGAMANFYNAINLCDNNEIIVQLDGDDWLANDHVLDLLNKVYADPDVWLTYGQFEYYPSGKKGFCKLIPDEIIKNNNFRSYGWLASALRSFYAGLFKSIKQEDLLFEGDFVPMAQDMATMIPIFEMAGFKSKFIPDILYIYNRTNPISDSYVNKELQFNIDKFIRSKEKYTPLETNPYNNNL